MSETAATIIGVDIGGSKTRGILWHSGAVRADVTVGSANVQNVPVAEAQANLARLFEGLGLGALPEGFGPDGGASDGGDPTAVGTAGVETAGVEPAGVEVYVGAGGIDTAADAAALAALIQPLAPAARVTVVHDTRLLLAAGGSSTGVAVIAGTGSAAWGVNHDGDESRAGGWGYLLGDEGSGYWLGREAVRHSLQRMNLGLAPDALTKALLLRCGLDAPAGLIAHFHGGTGRHYWAAMSPVVFDAAAGGHDEALAMIDEAGQDLAAMAAQCATALANPGPVVLGGGLGMNQPLLQNSFRAHLARHGITDVLVLERDPVFGALELAASRPARPASHTPSGDSHPLERLSLDA